MFTLGLFSLWWWKCLVETSGHVGEVCDSPHDKNKERPELLWWRDLFFVCVCFAGGKDRRRRVLTFDFSDCPGVC